MTSHCAMKLYVIILLPVSGPGRGVGPAPLPLRVEDQITPFYTQIKQTFKIL